MHLFAYGVLMHPELLRILTGREFVLHKCRLHDFRRYALIRDGHATVPGIVRTDGSSVDGILVSNLDQRSLRVLDDFEGVATGLYSRERVSVHDHSRRVRTACAYVAGPVALDCLHGDWDPVEFLQRYYEEYRTQIIPQFVRGQ